MCYITYNFLLDIPMSKFILPFHKYTANKKLAERFLEYFYYLLVTLLFLFVKSVNDMFGYSAIKGLQALYNFRVVI